MISIVLVLSLWIGPAPTLADLEFSMAVERWVEADPPAPYRSAIERLGSSSYAAREAASAELTRLSVLGDRRWLWSGYGASDPEIRLRLTTIIRRLNPCGSCRGSGQSRHYREDPCWDCQGIGSVWVWSAFDAVQIRRWGPR